MAKETKKHVWQQRTPSDGTMVLDMRAEPAQGDLKSIEQGTYVKISGYGFDRPVLFFGFSSPPTEKPEVMRRKESQNCVAGDQTRNIVFIGHDRMEWYLEANVRTDV